MRIVIIIFGVFLILAGLLLVVDPDIIYNYLTENADRNWLYITAIAVRLVLGFFLIWSASNSRYPLLVKIFGYLFITAAIIILVMGHEAFQDLITSLIPELNPIGRIGGLLSMAFGGFFVYAYTGRK